MREQSDLKQFATGKNKAVTTNRQKGLIIEMCAQKSVLSFIVGLRILVRLRLSVSKPIASASLANVVTE